jgi:hypothetical protein
MRRTDLQDTSPEAHRKLVARLRAMTPLEKGVLLNQRIEEMRAMRKHTDDLRSKKPK